MNVQKTAVAAALGKMTKRSFSVAVALVVLTACGSGPNAATLAASGGAVIATPASIATCAAAYKPPMATPPAGTKFCASLSTAPDASGNGLENGKTCRARTAVDIVRDMGQGWNLGNTLDAFGNAANPLADETYWGNPKTTKAMIDTLRKAGFTTLRLPVSWDDHMSGAARTIDPVWMNRVEEVAKYALDNGMAVIVNIHHNNGWEAPTLANEASAKDTLSRLWTQISERFNKYDQHVTFEVMNEPRVAPGGVDDWTGKAEYYDVLNRLNATALAAIRATGGNNTRRLVMIPSYAAAPDDAQLNPLVLPSDPMIALSSHAYRPWNFAGEQKGTSIFSGQAEFDQLFSRLNAKYVAKGIPVVIGEWASTDKDNAAERVKHATAFVQGAAKYGMPTIWWDNGNHTRSATSTDVMALLDRSNNTWPHQNINDAIFCAAQH
jgi:endoglucanase